MVVRERTRDWLFTKGCTPWNKDTGGCRKGHDPTLYVEMPSGVSVCLGCKRENGARYREDNREQIRKLNRVRRYGITVAEFDALWDKQNGCCAICGTALDSSYHIDHEHSSGKVRGILCVSCNMGIGCFKDSPELLNKVIVYLYGN